MIIVKPIMLIFWNNDLQFRFQGFWAMLELESELNQTKIRGVHPIPKITGRKFSAVELDSELELNWTSLTRNWNSRNCTLLFWKWGNNPAASFFNVDFLREHCRGKNRFPFISLRIHTIVKLKVGWPYLRCWLQTHKQTPLTVNDSSLPQIWGYQGYIRVKWPTWH